MATEEDLRRIALALPETAAGRSYHDSPSFRVAGRLFLRLRTEAEGALVMFVPDLGEKQALLEGEPGGLLHHAALRRLPDRPGPAAGDRGGRTA